MKRSKAVPLALTALLAATITGCGGEQEPDSYAICVDPQTQQRVDDDRCDDDDGTSGGGFAWFYFGGINAGRTYGVPPIGGSYTGTGGTLTKPSGTTQLGGISKTGGQVFKGSPSVSRGGFGGRGFGGGGG